jgi:protein O-mannosyl-transferase
MLYDYVFVSRSFRVMLCERWKFHAAMLATLVIGYVLHLASAAADVSAGLTSRPGEQIPPLIYLLTQFGVILHYLKLSVAPYPLCMDYAWPIAVEWREILPAAVVVVALFLVACRAVWGRKPYGFLAAWFFLMLAPSSSFFPLADMASEHRMYLAVAGVICAVVFGCHRLVGLLSSGCSGRIRNLVGVAILVAVVCTLAVMTHQRNRDYHSDLTMWRDVVTKRPDNFRSYITFLSALIKEGRASEAELVARSALKRMDESRHWIGEKGGFIRSYADFWRPGVQNELGRSLLAQRRREEAIACFKDVLSAQPGNTTVLCNLGFALYLDGKKGEALRVLDEVIRGYPNYEKPRIIKARILEEGGDFKAALDLYQHVVDKDAASMWAKCELARILATCPDDGIRDGQRAVMLAEDVCGATLHLSVRALDVLAAAYAETGRFDDAVRTATRALKLAADRNNNSAMCLADGTEDITTEPPAGEQVSEISRRLEIYKQGKPFRMESHGNSAPGANGSL